MDFGTAELSSSFREGRSVMHSPDFEGFSLEIEHRLTWPTIGRAFRSVVRKLR